MKKHCLLSGILLAVLLAGCASYQASSLSALDPEYVKAYPHIEGLLIGCKVYSKGDCYNYLDRDVMAKGYQPVQLTFHNTSDKSYVFSTEKMNPPCANPEDVAETVHTATTGRILGYGLGGLMFPPLFIAAIVDGIKSSNANVSLDKDFDEKTTQRFVIPPGSFKKTLIFIPQNQFQSSFRISLFEEETGTYKTVELLGVA